MNNYNGSHQTGIESAVTYAERVGFLLDYVRIGEFRDSLRVSCNLNVTCVIPQVVHAIYKKHEIWPSSYLPTVLLLLVPPTISTGFYRQSLPTVWISLLASFTLFYFVLGSSIIIYRLSPTHPLHQYPGPLGAKVSKLWMMSVAATGKLNEYIKKLHDEYGPYVRIGKCL